MTTSTLTPSFRQVVADVAARAKAKLPETINGRLEGAVKLVLAHDVTPQADGTILVGSCTDPLKTYRLVGLTCECKDFTDGKAPVDAATGQRWCRHRIAAGIAKRVGELLPAVVVPEEMDVYPDNEVPDDEPLPPELLPEARQPAPVPAPALPEAPASCNVYLLIGGHKVQVTLRDRDEARMLIRLEELLQRFPVPQAPAQVHGHSHTPQASPQPAAPPAPTPEKRFCPLHGTEMQLNHKDGRTWWSHRTDQGWCKGR